MTYRPSMCTIASHALLLEERGPDTIHVLGEVLRERERQNQKFPDQHLPDGTGPCVAWTADWRNEPAMHLVEYARDRTDRAATDGTLTWLDVQLEELAEAFTEEDTTRLRAELIQVAAVAVRWVEDIDQRNTPRPEDH